MNAWELRCWEDPKQRVALGFLQNEHQGANKDFSMAGGLSLVPGRAKGSSKTQSRNACVSVLLRDLRQSCKVTRVPVRCGNSLILRAPSMAWKPPHLAS